MRVVADDTSGDNISQSVMISRGDFSSTRSKELDGVKQAWNKAVAEINANPESYRSLLVSKAQLSDVIASTYKVSEYPEAQLPTQEQVDNVLKWMIKKGYLSNSISYDAATGSFSGR